MRVVVGLTVVDLKGLVYLRDGGWITRLCMSKIWPVWFREQSGCLVALGTRIV